MLTYPTDSMPTVEFIPGDSPPDCVNDCLDCKRVCLETLGYCTQKGGTLATPARLKLFLDCAMLCEPTAYFIARRSDARSELCNICAQVCHTCAEECERFAGDALLETCAETCRRCAESCARVAQMASRVPA